jgi:hypothetical protein
MENKLLRWFSYNLPQNEDNLLDGKMVKPTDETLLKSNSALLMETLDELIDSYVKRKVEIKK